MFKIITIYELLEMLNNYDYRELHVHHTWEPNHSHFSGENGVELQNNMRDYHLSLGWSDIGQHVTLLPNGLFVTGRNFGQNPASISGQNERAFACETLGNFDFGNDVLEEEQKRSLLMLAKYFDDRNKYVRFHRENSLKTCPGTSIDKEIFLEEMRALDNETLPVIKYQAHVQNIGWQDWILSGTDLFAGTVGESLRLEALTVILDNSNGNIVVEGHIQNRGWQSPRNEGEPIGTIGQELRLEAIKMHLEGVEGYYVQYRAHIQDIGWTEWETDGDVCGNIGESRRIEAIQIRLV